MCGGLDQTGSLFPWPSLAKCTTKHQNYRRNMGLSGGLNGPEVAHWPIDCTCFLGRQSLGSSGLQFRHGYKKKVGRETMFSVLLHKKFSPWPVCHSGGILRGTENSLVLVGQPHPLLGQTRCSHLYRRPKRELVTLIPTLRGSHGAVNSGSQAHLGFSLSHHPTPIQALQAVLGSR